MKDNAISKINQFGKIGNIVVTVLKVLTIIGLTLATIGMIVLLMLPKDFIQFTAGGAGTITVDLGAVGQELSESEREDINSGKTVRPENFKFDAPGNNLQMNEIKAEGNKVILTASGDLANTVSIHDFAYVLIVAIVALAVTLVSLFFGGFLCKAFNKCESPFEENVIKQMKYFAYSLIPWVVLDSILNSFVTSFMNGRMDVNVSIDFTMVAIVLIVLALVQIFKYGAILQQESDETL